MTNTKLDYALALAAKGFRVFPLAANTKIPLKGFTDFAKNATTNKDLITRWFIGTDHNIGISTENLLVVDVDVKNEKKNGLETIKHLLKVGKVFPQTTCQVTTSGGFHYVYDTPYPVRNSASKLGPGLDVRGAGGYIAAWGSTINGKSYQMDTNRRNMAPQWLLEACTQSTMEKPKAHLKVAGVDEERAKKRGSEYLARSIPTTEGSRNQAGFIVAAHLKDLGINLEDTFLMMMDEWKCEPPLELDELKAVVTSAYKYGKEAQGSAAPEAMFASPETEVPPGGKHPFEILNEEYAFVAMGSGHRILYETTDEEGQFTTAHLSEDTFHKKLAARKLQTGDGNSKPLTKAWMASGVRRSYEGIVFAPGEEIDPRYYNLWRGFSFEPLAADEEPTGAMKDAIAKFEEHLFVNICDSDVDHYNWVYAWFAHIIQKPSEKLGVALVMKGRKGVGKNALLDCVGNLFPNNYMVTAQKRHLLSNFNSHMEKLLLLVLNEAFWGGSKEEGAILKQLITEKDIEIERKGVDSYKMKSRFRTAIVGNESWIIPASEDERRYAVFNIGESRMQDTKFFTAMREGMEAGGYRYLLTKLLAFDLSKVDLRVPPDTKGLAEQKENSLDAFERWWMDVLIQGYIEGVSFGEKTKWETVIDKRDLIEIFISHTKSRRGSNWLPSDKSILDQLIRLVPAAVILRQEDCADKIKLPPLKECRASWDKIKRSKNKWV